MKYFITGGSGLIGSFLLPRIEAGGDEFFNFDMYYGFNIMNVAQLGRELNRDGIFGPDVVVHLAGQSGVESARLLPAESLSVNVMGTVNVLEACRLAGIKNVVVASSNHVYGKQQPAPPFREDAPLNQRDLYSASKICADVITQAYAHNYGMNTVAVRVTNTYGPNDPHNDHLIPGTIKALVDGKTPMLRSEGKIKKSYLYGEDCASAFIAIAENCEELAGQAVNVVGCKPVSALEIVEMLRDISGVDLPVGIGAEPNDQADEDMSSTIMAGLGWLPEHTLREGLKKTYEWFADRVQVPA